MNSERKRCGDLLSELTDGNLDEQQFKELSNLLDRNEDLRAYSIEYLDTVALLNELKGSAPSPSSHLAIDLPSVDDNGTKHLDVAASPRGISKVPRRFEWTLLLLAVAILLIANLATMLYQQRKDHPQSVTNLANTETATESSSNISPHLVSMTACLWHADSSPKLKQSLRAGEVIELLAGIAEFEIANNYGHTARILVEGPASILAQRNQGLTIQHGLVTANSGDCLGEFRIGVPGGSVTFQASSSIGIDLSLSGSEIHTFEGTARFRRSASEGINDDSILIEKGESAKFLRSVNHDVVVSRGAADENLFASTRSMSFDQLRIPASYAEAVLESHPDIYWRFNSARHVTNLASKDQWNATLEGDVLWNRYGSNLVPEFGMSTDGSSIVLCNDRWPPKPLEDFSVEVWAKPSHYHNATMVALCESTPRDRRYGHAFMLEVSASYDKPDESLQQNRIRFLQRNPPGSYGGTSCFSKNVYKVRAWQHVVARKQAGVMELFINGKLAATERHEAALIPDMKIVVGQLYPRRQYERSFIGQLDEVAFYSHALSDEEIQKHFDAASSKRVERNEARTSSSADLL
ncbi:MAG: LamG-like jellyroll fold domain-containing protein [Rhodopirellula sp. JB044]|uniref:LamG-like jellyroll fold domain-containing protein n=1 Tax=Rhodopirellula sp. JB044 TaxID=3342844 RepID=UPI00370CE5A5